MSDSIPLVHLSFDLRPRTEQDPKSDDATVAQCNFQYADGSLTSFDPEQLPDIAKKVLGELVVQQSGALAAQVTAHEEAIATKDAALTYANGEVDRLRAIVQEHDPEAVYPPEDATPPVATQEEDETAMPQPEPPVK